MIVTIAEAEKQLPELIQRALDGEEILLTNAGDPPVRLTPVHTRFKPRILGSWEGKVQIADDFDAPLPEELLNAFYHGPIEPVTNK